MVSAWHYFYLMAAMHSWKYTLGSVLLNIIAIDIAIKSKGVDGTQSGLSNLILKAEEINLS